MTQSGMRSWEQVAGGQGSYVSPSLGRENRSRQAGQGSLTGDSGHQWRMAQGNSFDSCGWMYFMYLYG